MEIEVEYVTETEAILRPSGRMDAVSAPQVQEKIEEVIDAGVTTLVVDLDEVYFMDSSGLRVLVSGLKALRRQGANPLKICNVNPQVKTALRLTMLDRAFDVYNNVAEAMASIEA